MSMFTGYRTYSDRNARAAAKRGSRFLDKLYPGWYKTVKITTLNLNHCGVCVLGQLAKDSCFLEVVGYTRPSWQLEADPDLGYSEVVATVVEHLTDQQLAKLSGSKSSKLGFNIHHTYETDTYTDRGKHAWAYLTEAWKDEIRTRRDKDRELVDA